MDTPSRQTPRLQISENPLASPPRSEHARTPLFRSSSFGSQPKHQQDSYHQAIVATPITQPHNRDSINHSTQATRSPRSNTLLDSKHNHHHSHSHNHHQHFFQFHLHKLDQFSSHDFHHDHKTESHEINNPLILSNNDTEDPKMIRLHRLSMSIDASTSKNQSYNDEIMTPVFEQTRSQQQQKRKNQHHQQSQQQQQQSQQSLRRSVSWNDESECLDSQLNHHLVQITEESSHTRLPVSKLLTSMDCSSEERIPPLESQQIEMSSPPSKLPLNQEEDDGIMTPTDTINQYSSSNNNNKNNSHLESHPIPAGFNSDCEIDQSICRERQISSNLPIAQSPILFPNKEITPFKFTNQNNNKHKSIVKQRKQFHGPRFSAEQIKQPSCSTTAGTSTKEIPEKSRTMIRRQTRRKTTKKNNQSQRSSEKKASCCYLEPNAGVLQIPDSPIKLADHNNNNNQKKRIRIHSFGQQLSSSEEQASPTIFRNHPQQQQPLLKVIQNSFPKSEEEVLSDPYSPQSVSKFRSLEKGLLLHFRQDPLAEIPINKEETESNYFNNTSHQHNIGEIPSPSFEELPATTSAAIKPQPPKYTNNLERSIFKMMAQKQNPNLRQSILLPNPNSNFQRSQQQQQQQQQKPYLQEIISSLNSNAGSNSSSSSSSSSSSQSCSSSSDEDEETSQQQQQQLNQSHPLQERPIADTTSPKLKFKMTHSQMGITLIRSSYQKQPQTLQATKLFSGFSNENSPKLASSLVFDGAEPVITSIRHYNHYHHHNPNNINNDHGFITTLSKTDLIKKCSDSTTFHEHQQLQQQQPLESIRRSAKNTKPSEYQLHSQQSLHLQRCLSSIKQSHSRQPSIKSYGEIDLLDQTNALPYSIESQTTNLILTKPNIQEFAANLNFLPHKFCSAKALNEITTEKSRKQQNSSNAATPAALAGMLSTAPMPSSAKIKQSQYEFFDSSIIQAAKSRTNELLKSVTSLFQESQSIQPKAHSRCSPETRKSSPIDQLIKQTARDTDPQPFPSSNPFINEDDFIDYKKSSPSPQAVAAAAAPLAFLETTKKSSFIKKQTNEIEIQRIQLEKSSFVINIGADPIPSFTTKKSSKLPTGSQNSPKSPSKLLKQPIEWNTQISQAISPPHFRENQATTQEFNSFENQWQIPKSKSKQTGESEPVEETHKLTKHSPSIKRKKQEITKSKIDFSAISFKSDIDLGPNCYAEPMQRTTIEQSQVHPRNKSKKFLLKSTISNRTHSVNKTRTSQQACDPFPDKCLSCNEKCEELFILSTKCINPICAECIQSYIEELITNNDILKIRCPFISCTHKLRSEHFKQFISHEFLKTYKRLKKLLIKRKNPHIRYCTQQNCGGYMIGSEDQPKLFCPKCAQEICYRCCNNWHQGRRCDQALDEEEKVVVQEEKRECPKCQARIQSANLFSEERASLYSNKIVCQQCSYEYCQLCSRSCGVFHFAPWNVCFGCPGQKYSTELLGQHRLACLFLWGLMKLIIYLIIALLILICYPIIICLVALFMPLILYAYFYGQRRQYSGCKKYCLLTGFFIAGVIFYPFWILFSIFPGTYLFLKDIYHEKQLKEQNLNRSLTLD